MKEDRGSIVLQLQRAIKVNRNRENGKQREKWGNAGIRGAMRREGVFEREQVNVSHALMMVQH